MKAITSIILAVFMLFSFSVLNAQSVDLKKTGLSWIGKKVTGEHSGNISLKSGELKYNQSQISSGKFVIDMNSITCTDITDPEYNGKLVGHLKSDDFFGTSKFPEAVITISKPAKIVNGSAEINAVLTIKEISNPITFTAIKTKSGFKSTITVDRSKYNVRYGSGSFFDGLGDNMIYDEFILNVNLFVSE